VSSHSNESSYNLLGGSRLLTVDRVSTGHITIVDNDTVEISNLHRQVLHAQSRVGMSKVESARLGIKRCERFASLSDAGVP